MCPLADMGDIADAMTSGGLCEMCGVALCDDCADMGMPMYCSKSCARDRGGDVSQVCTD